VLVLVHGVLLSSQGCFTTHPRRAAYATGMMTYAGEVHEWRCRVKLAVRGSVVRPQVGLFEAKSHRLLPVPHCRVHHPRLNDAVAALLQVCPATLTVQLDADHPPGGAQVSRRASALPGSAGLSLALHRLPLPRQPHLLTQRIVSRRLTLWPARYDRR